MNAPVAVRKRSTFAASGAIVGFLYVLSGLSSVPRLLTARGTESRIGAVIGIVLGVLGAMGVRSYLRWRDGLIRRAVFAQALAWTLVAFLAFVLIAMSFQPVSLPVR